MESILAISDYEFFFEARGRTRTEGVVSPEEEMFLGEDSDLFLARELGQNALDAKAPGNDGPVKMEFELRELQTSQIPDVENLRRHVFAAAEAVHGTNEHNDRLDKAIEILNEPTVWVLRVGDYGTTGLTGTEKLRDDHSSLVALTRGSGVSAGKQGKGGSFGIGAAVGPASSLTRTVFYSTVSKDHPVPVIAGSVRLASHLDPNASKPEMLGAYGFLNKSSDTSDFSYLRSNEPLLGFAPRTEFGTDMFIIGYRNAGVDQGLSSIKNAFLSDFMIAISRGRLEISGITPIGNWHLDSATIADQISEVRASRPDIHAYYSALNDESPFVEVDSNLGEMKLYINVDDSLDKLYHTYAVRSPLIKVEILQQRGLPARYAAVFECSNEVGNELLRRLEPPLHDKWDPGRDKDPKRGRKIKSTISSFIRRGLRDRIGKLDSDNLTIEGLNEILPNLMPEDSQNTGEGVHPSTGEAPNAPESSRIQGAESVKKDLPVMRQRDVRGTVKKPATAAKTGTPGSTGKKRGGSGKRTASGNPFDSAVTDDPGASLMASENVSFRAWFEEGNSVIAIVLKNTGAELVGSLTLAALDSSNSDVEIDLQISSVETEVRQDKPVSVKGNLIAGIVAPSGLTKVSVRVGTTDKFKIGVL